MDLLNEFWRATESEKHLASYKSLVRRARPYSFDADAVDLITELSSGETIHDRLHLYRKLARLPFDVVWMELSYADRDAARRRLGTVNVPPQDDLPINMGFLIERVADTQWRVLTVVEYPEGVTGSGRTTDTFGTLLTVSTEGPVQASSRVKDPSMREVVEEMNREGYGAMGWGMGVTTRDGVVLDDSPKLNMSVHFDMAPSYEYIISQKDELVSERKARTRNLMTASANELRGDLRWVVAALALINEVPLKISDVRRPGNMRVGGSLRPYMVNRTIEIAIPKTRGRFRKVLSMMRTAERAMRRHEVAGHWRTVTKNGVKERRWIEHYERGDASLGFVRQVREVKS